ncbi:MAG: STAS domain-containing protein [Planctomycetota bacterium]
MNITEYGNVTVLIPKDDLVGEFVDVFKAKTAERLALGKFDLVVDCTSLDGFDSAGLEALVDLQNRCEDELGSVKLCGLDETLTKILDITRLMRRFEVFAELESAVKSFDQ